MDKEKIIKSIENGNIAEAFDESIKDINNDTSTRRLLLEKFALDIEQYLDESFGDNKPIVALDTAEGEDRTAIIIWDMWEMKPIAFYAGVFNNKGKMTPELFKEYGKKKTAKE